MRSYLPVALLLCLLATFAFSLDLDQDQSHLATQTIYRNGQLVFTNAPKVDPKPVANIPKAHVSANASAKA